MSLFCLFVFLSSEGYKIDRAIAVEFTELVHTICHSDTGCVDGTTPCYSDSSCTISLMVDKYNPDLDWGIFIMNVSHGNTSINQTVVVDADPWALVTVTPLSASMSKVWQKQWCLFYLYCGAPRFIISLFMDVGFTAIPSCSTIFYLSLEVSSCVPFFSTLSLFILILHANRPSFKLVFFMLLSLISLYVVLSVQRDILPLWLVCLYPTDRHHHPHLHRQWGLEVE